MTPTKVFEPPVTEPVVERFPLSTAQRRVWDRQEGGAAIRAACVVDVEGEIAPATIAAALRRTVARHEILRASFEPRAGLEAPFQVLGEVAAIEWRDLDLAATHGEGRDRSLAEILQDHHLGNGDLASEPVLRATLAALGPGSARLFLSAPALCTDAYSLRRVVEELAALLDVPPGDDGGLGEPFEYLDFCEWQREYLESDDEESVQGRAYWQRRGQAAARRPPWPFEIPAEARRRAASRPATIAVDLGRAAADALARHAASLGLDETDLLRAAWWILAWRFTGAGELVIDELLSGRTDDELRSTLGPIERWLPVAAQLTESETFERLAARLARARRETSIWQHTFDPGEEPAEAPSSGFSYRSRPELRSAAGVTLRWRHSSLAAPAGLVLEATRGSAAGGRGGLSLELVFDGARFTAADVAPLALQLARLLEQAAEAPQTAAGKLAVVSDAEQRRLLKTLTHEPAGRAPAGGAPAGGTIHRRFEARAAASPRAAAVAVDGHRLDYAELNARANRLARHLRSLGVATDTPVALYLERSPELVVAVLAILKAGGCYVAFDTTQPRRRIAAMLEDVRPAAVVSREPWAGRLPADGELEIVDLDRDLPAIDRRPDGDLGVGGRPQGLAYVIFTSGSTGRPKGVMVEHRQLLSYVDAVSEGLELRAGWSWASVSTLAADLGNTAVFGALLGGGCLHLVDQQRATDPEALAGYLEEHQIDCVKIVPSHLEALETVVERSRLMPRERLVVGGEASRRAWAVELRRAAGECRIFNHYGPSETTVGVMVHELAADPDRRSATVPIGRPLAGTSIRLLGRDGRPAPAWMPGEIRIGGTNLSRGYYGKPASTAERFVPDPWSGEPGRRLYRTGDLARRLPGGAVEFLGRRDHQVKFHGFRIELEEIRHALNEHPKIRDSVVRLLPDRDGHDVLVAYYVSRLELPFDELREMLSETLLEEILPNLYVHLRRLPLNLNGKINLAALPGVEEARAKQNKPFVAPRDELEEMVAGVWAEILGRERVSVDDHFFELGGHSLLAARILARLRQRSGAEIPLRAIFETPTVAGLAAAIGALLEARDHARIAPPGAAARPDEVPLSFAQERFWILDQLQPGSTHYNIPAAVRLHGTLDAGALCASFGRLLARHEVLRTHFAVSPTTGLPVQQVAPPEPFRLPEIDLGALAEDDRRQALGEHLRALGRLTFDLARGPLVAAWLVRLEAASHALLMSQHHSITDGWSLRLEIREITAAYRELTTGEASGLPELPFQYADFACWQRRWLDRERVESQLGYWRRQLGGELAVLDLPTDFPRPPVRRFRGEIATRDLPGELREELALFARRESATLYWILLAAFKLVLYRWSGQTDVLVGSPIAGRNLEDTENLVGLFLNTLVLRTDLSGQPTFRGLLGRVRQTAVDAYENQDVPFERLLEELRPERDLSRTPLFQVFFNMLSLDEERLQLPGVRAEPLAALEGGPNFDFTIYVREHREGIRLVTIYDADLFTGERMAELLAQLESVLRQAAGDPELDLDEFSLATPRAAAALPAPGEDLDATWRGAIHDRFRELAARWPERPAVVDPKTRWSYGELDRRSEALAAWLQSRGAGRGERVAIYAHRSAPLVAAILGVLKSGAAFVILDPTYPGRRQAEIAARVAPRAWLRIAAAGEPPAELAGALADLPVRTLSAEHAKRVEDAAGIPFERPALLAEDLAYVAFTSGSSGEPKGIAGRHGSLSHFLPWQCERFELGPADGYTLLSGLAHDPLHRDLFTPLGTGGRVEIPDPEDVGEPGRLAAWMARRQVTVAHLTPAMGQLLSEDHEADPSLTVPSLRWALFVGDVLTRRDLDRLARLAPEARWINLYGSTETQRAVAYHAPDRHSGDDGESAARHEILPLGRGMPAVQLLVLDRCGRLAGTGEVGEICVRSPHIALGYFGAPAATAERFVPNPLATGPVGTAGDRVYRTGDRGRYLPGGDVAFAGRTDQQVKVRGYRVEPGEIEAILGRHPAVRQAVVLLHRDPRVGPRLVAYVTAAAGASAAAPSELRDFLGERLPRPLVPAVFLLLDELPLTPNRKIDRGALRRLPLPEPAGGGVFEPPRTPLEAALAEIWREVLGVERIGRHDDFFELGGQSLLATQVLARVRRRFEVEVPLRTLFEAPALAGWAARVRDLRQAAAGIERPPLRSAAGERSALPLSFAQERLWILDRIEGGSPAYNLPLALRLHGTVDPDALRRALGEVVSRHETLRSCFPSIAGRPVQRIAPTLNPALPVIDLRALPAGDREAVAGRRLRAGAAAVFDLGAAPLWRIQLLSLSADDWILALNFHHTLADAWSFGVLIAELAALYRAALEDRPSPLPELALQYADYAAWQRGWLAGERLRAELTHWRGRLAGGPQVLDLPTDRPRPAVQTARGAYFYANVGSELGGRLRTLARTTGSTLFMVLLAGFQGLLHRLTGSPQIAVGTPVANRDRVELEALIGFLVNTLVLRTGCAGDPTFGELLARVREVALDAYAHQDLPFEKLVEELQPERDLAHSPLFQVMFILQNTPVGTVEVPGLSLEPMALRADAAKFDLTLSVAESGGGLTASWEYNRDLFDATTVRRMAGHFEALLRSATSAPETRLSAVPLLSDAETQQVVVEWASSPAAADAAADVVARVAGWAERTPEAVALVAGQTQLTYRELSRRADRLAGCLRGLGVGPEALVGVHAGRSPELAIALLAVLRAGAAYVPLDVAHPGARLEKICEEALGTAGAVLITDRRRAEEPRVNGRTLRLDEVRLDDGNGLDGDGLDVPEAVDRERLAYVIYTSGSTGRPKGVAISRHALATFLAAMSPGRGPGETLLSVTTFSFDIFGLELFLPLATGGRVIIADAETAVDSTALAAVLAASRAGAMQATPATWRLLVDSGWRGGPRFEILCGGEALSEDLAAVLAGRCATLWNLYGPTEATVWASRKRIARHRAPVSLGRPLPRTSWRVVDRLLNPAAAGVHGELVLGGPQLARGYLRRAALTAERFIPDPFSGRPGARLYRTGDRARFLANGEVEFLGRLDHQLKIRGFRIEPGEIEAALTGHPRIRQAVAMADDRARLAAFVVAAGDKPAIEELRELLRDRLPHYMIPSLLLPVDELPLTPNGKIDRAALRRLASSARTGESGAGAAPASAIETALAAIWREVLRVDEVAPGDDFFHLGGHSLLANQVVARARRELRVELPLRALFEAPTLAALARRVEDLRRSAAGPQAPSLRREARGSADRIPLSFAQERLWLLDRIEAGTPAYNLPLALRLDGTLEPAALRLALAGLSRRHEILRTRFADDGGRPFQVIAPPVPPPLPILDLAALSSDDAGTQSDRWLAAEAGRLFDLETGPLYRVGLFVLPPARQILVLNLHHVISDAWSIAVFVRELAILYRAAVENRPAALPELAVQYADYALWQRRWLHGERLEAEVEHWRRCLAGGSHLLELPADRPRPALQTYRGDHLYGRLDRALGERLAALGRRTGSTLFMVLVAGFKTLLHRLTGEPQITLGTPVANRDRVELETLIGFLVNTLVLRTSTGGDPGFEELLGRVREVALDAYAHQELPFEKLVEELRPRRDLAHSPLFQVMFILQNAPLDAFEVPGLSLEPRPLRPATSKFDLTLSVSERDGGLETSWEYNRDLFDATTLRRMASQLETLLEAAARRPSTRLSDLPLLSPAQLHQVLAEWSRGPGQGAASDAVRAFETWARRTPEAVAVEAGDVRLTYGELERRADRLARQLRARGVGPETRVGIHAARSAQLAVALLAVLKAGGAYVPLDVAHPRARLESICDEALAERGASVLLTDRRRDERLRFGGVTLRLDEAGSAPALPAEPPPAARRDSLAYVIYTSGSTGRPKGVQITRRALATFLDALRPGWKAGDTLFSVTTFSFDIFGLELFLPLTSGGRVVLAEPATVLDGRALARALTASRARAMQATPSGWRILLDAGWPGEPRLEALCGGEALPHALAAELAARCARLRNLYGPTEATIWASQKTVGVDPTTPGTAASIGRPLPASRWQVADRRLRAVPPAVPGELLLGGPQLARGYLGRPALTAEKLVPDPFAGRPGARLYRTGDRARWLTGGEVEFLGRLDHQIKIRGFRIEPGEIEAVLAGHPGIRQAVAVAAAGSELPGSGSHTDRLVAYVVPEAGPPAAGAPDVAEWIDLANRRLPSYMVPSAFVVLEELPRTASGKLDRAALPAPETAARPHAATFRAPRTETERRLIATFRDVLGTERLGVDDNFFDLGGSSAHLVQVQSRLRDAFDRELRVVDLFAHPTVAELASFLASRRPAAGRETPPDGRQEALEIGRGRLRSRFARLKALKEGSQVE